MAPPLSKDIREEIPRRHRLRLRHLLARRVCRDAGAVRRSGGRRRHQADDGVDEDPRRDGGVAEAGGPADAGPDRRVVERDDRQRRDPERREKGRGAQEAPGRAAHADGADARAVRRPDPRRRHAGRDGAAVRRDLYAGRDPPAVRVLRVAAGPEDAGEHAGADEPQHGDQQPRDDAAHPEDDGAERAKHRRQIRRRDDPGLQLLRRSRRPPERSPAPGRRRDARLARQRHVRDGDEPSRPRIHFDREAGRSRPARTAGHPGQLQGLVPAGRGPRPERDHPAQHGGPQAAARHHRFRAHGFVVRQVDQGSAALRERERGGVRRSEPLHDGAAAGDVAAERRRGLPAPVHERDHRRRRDRLRADRARRHAARRRHVVAHPVAPDRRVEIRRDLRRRAKEHRPGRPDDHDRARGPARPCAADLPGRVQLARGGRGGVDAEHAADVRDLHRGPRVRAPEKAGRRSRDGTPQHRKSAPAVRGAGRRRLLPESRGARLSLAHERTVLPAR
ncbi:hypothetical protein Lal_00015009 [Lupinus albus]|nr:hypothetical protein Lal_00015009 [Lupinus albus]